MKSKVLGFLLVSSFMFVGITSSVFSSPIDLFLGGTGPYSYPGYFTDAEKNSGTADDNYCWAAAASNVLAWTGWDAGFGNEDAIFANFQTNWTGDYGSWARFGMEWWFTGGVDPTDPAWIALQAGGSDYYTGGGGYYTQAEYDANVRYWEDLSASPDVTGTDVQVQSFIDDGYATALGLYYSVWDPQQQTYVTAGAHAVTMWGYRTDTDYLGIWISDSDNHEGSAAPAPDTLNLYELEYRYNWGWYLDGYGGHEWWIGTLAGLLPNADTPPPPVIPEPSSLLLLGTGLGALVLVAHRRRKK